MYIEDSNIDSHSMELIPLCLYNKHCNCLYFDPTHLIVMYCKENESNTKVRGLLKMQTVKR